MDQNVQFLTHENPVWREKANFIIHAKMDTSDGVLRFEQLWVRQLNNEDTHFEICCIPFFLYNLALGDKVSTVPGYGKKYILHEIIEPSGHHTFRVWFKKDDSKSEIAHVLEEMGCLLEWQTQEGNLLALDVSSDKGIEDLADYLWKREQQGMLIYETGKQ